MQITNGTSFGGRKVVFDSVIDDVPGGLSLNVARLDYTNPDKKYIKAGAPVYYDESTRLAELCKSALGITGGTSTAPRIDKRHHFKVNDFIGDGTNTAKITNIDSTTSTAYDTLTVNTALTFAAGTKFVEGTVTGASAVLKFTPNGLIKSDEYIKDGNVGVSVVRMGTVRNDALDYPLPDLYVTALRGAKSYIIVN